MRARIQAARDPSTVMVASSGVADPRGDRPCDRMRPVAELLRGLAFWDPDAQQCGQMLVALLDKRSRITVELRRRLTLCTDSGTSPLVKDRRKSGSMSRKADRTGGISACFAAEALVVAISRMSL